MRQTFSAVVCAILALSKDVYARKCLETDAYITPRTYNKAETQIGNHMLNLAAIIDDEDESTNAAPVDDEFFGNIVTTKDIDNYFNL